MIREAGEVEQKVVSQELFAEMRSQVRILSSVEGLRQMVSFPFSVVRNMSARIKTNGINDSDKAKDVGQ
jgi:hypothetical protein